MNLAENAIPKKIYLIDASAFIFRAYHALPPLTRPDGTPVNAVMGFSNMLLKLLEKLNPEDGMAVIFDAARENFRNDIFADYKANRDSTPEDLVPQFPLIREATKIFGFTPIEAEGFEADDLIATYAEQAEKLGSEAIIVSSDKDLMQLVTDKISMLDPMKNKHISYEEVFEKFGVTPERVIDVQALAGDKIDNVPGVPGIGVKIAAQLITEYGDLESLLAQADKIKQPKRRQNLIEHAEMARISYQLVKLDRSAPVPCPLDNLHLPKPDAEDLLLWLRTQGFRSLTTRVQKYLLSHDIDVPKLEEVQENPIEAAEITEVDYQIVTTEDALKNWIEQAYQAGKIAVDTETTSLTPTAAKLVGISLAVEAGKACYIPVGHQIQRESEQPRDLLDQPQTSEPEDAETIQQLPVETALKLLKPMLEDPSILKIGHNIKYDMQIFAQTETPVFLHPIEDTMLISYVIDGGTHHHSLDDLAKIHCNHTTVKFKDIAGTGKKQKTFDQLSIEESYQYAAEDADITLRLYQILKARLIQQKLVKIYEEIERPLVPVIAQMEQEGILLDQPFLANLSTEFDTQLKKLEIEIHELAEETFNIASPKQLGEVLFDKIGLSGGKKLKSGAWSTNSDILEPLAHDSEIVAKVLEFRQLAKLKSTYTDSLQKVILPKTGRVHTSFSLATTTTGRLASSDPNLQNIPIRTAEGRKIRQAFIPKQGCKLISIDYSQIELRLVAEMANIDALKDAFQKGLDIHASTASKVFNVPLEEMTSEIRRQAKAINFGIIYGISAFGLSRQLNISPKEASSFIKAYMQEFPELQDYMESIKETAREQGYVETLFGRRIHIKGMKDKIPARRNFAERQAVNAPIQGTAADIMKLAMINVAKELEGSNLNAKMLVQVHDELLFEVAETDCDALISLVKNVMETVASFSVPLIAEAGIGVNWDEAH